jgi:hypothetical protein
VAHGIVTAEQPTVTPEQPLVTGGRRQRTVLAVAVWVVVIALGTAIGLVLNHQRRKIVLPSPPLLGRWWLEVPPGIVLPLAAAGLVIAVLPRIAARSSWRVVLVATAAAASLWTVSLGFSEGLHGLTRGPSAHSEYLHDVPAVQADPSGFLRTFTRDIDRYEIHVRGHPPGMVLLLAGLDRLGLRGPSGEAAFVLAAAATAPIAVLLALRSVDGEHAARRAVPWLALAPAAIWIGTSADALYMTVVAWAVCLSIVATRRRGLSSWAIAGAAGVLAAGALLGSYGVALAAAIPAAVIVTRRRFDVAAIVAATAGGLLVVLWALSGYSWISGLRATAHEYQVLDLDRPYAAFFFINLAAWALALGPATFVGLARSGWSRRSSLVVGGAAAALLANVSGLSSGEVERIWLPFTLWVLPAGAALGLTHPSSRRWMAAQAATAVALTIVVRTQW